MKWGKRLPDFPCNVSSPEQGTYSGHTKTRPQHFRNMFSPLTPIKLFTNSDGDEGPDGKYDSDDDDLT